MLAGRAFDILEQTIRTSFNKQLCAMAVGVETCVLVHPLTTYGILSCGAPNPPLRKAAARYMPFPLDLRKSVVKSSEQNLWIT